MKLGSTGRFPQGKLQNDDEGEITLAVANVKDNVMIRFGHDVSWIAFPKAEALAFAALLEKKAKELP